MKLVFVHGAGESSLSFHYQLRHFEDSEGIDLPGHPDGKPCTSVEGYVEWVRGFVAARRYSDVVLCGHSMGGAIAQLYALKYPEELRGVILVGTGARLRVHPRYLKDCEDGSEDTAQWLENRKAEYSKIEPDLQQALIQRSEEVGPAVKLNDLLCCDKFDIMDRVGEIAVPAQVVCGTEDVMTPVKYSDYLANKIPGSRKSILDGATHYVQMERHREVNETIEEFLASLG
jgi:pimeloyl-ACP methyl ester carboxylesterase